MLLMKWRDWLRARLIDDWHRAGKFWSVRLAAVGAALQGFATAFPGMATEAWNALPDSMRAGAPGVVLKALPVILFLLVIVSRITKQKAPTDGQ